MSAARKRYQARRAGEGLLSRLVLAILTLLVFTGPVSADCSCACVGGENLPVCLNIEDLRPVCPLRVCPIERRAIQPITQPADRPMGTSSCQLRPTLTNNGFYEWQQACW
jgi:hypothetical protein